ncbi:MAG: chemotaxis protein CheW [Proteobacteria bacterium]|nr:chemotaxis protein CheW [Pseudomonadota bacterium]MBU1714334.1 chemotaxis protein CheW [Pseudomonadota bacterium]
MADKLDKNLDYDEPWDDDNQDNENLKVIFKIKDRSFALPAHEVEIMVAMPKIVSLPDSEPYLRGTINLRGEIIPVINLRNLLGIKSIDNEIEEFCQIMQQREQDHRNWIKELEASVREKREFKLATDPHKCSFGKWYDNFKTDNMELSVLLKRFDLPHKDIHGIAIKVEAFTQKKEFDRAYELINQTKDRQLARMIDLFSQVRSVVGDSVSREIAMVLNMAGSKAAISVDSVEGVEELQEHYAEDNPEIFPDSNVKWVSNIGRRHNSSEDDLVLILEPDHFFQLAARAV